MTNVYKFDPEKKGQVIFLEQDSLLRAIEDFIALMKFTSTDYDLLDILHIQDRVSLKVMQTTEEDPTIKAWYYISAASPEEVTKYRDSSAKSEQ